MCIYAYVHTSLLEMLIKKIGLKMKGKIYVPPTMGARVGGGGGGFLLFGVDPVVAVSESA